MTSQTASKFDKATLLTKISAMLSRELRIPVEKLDPDAPLTQYGLDSIGALTIAGELEDMVGMDLPSTLLWDCRTLGELVTHIDKLVSPQATVA